MDAIEDGTEEPSLMWEELAPFEQQQGGYWLYGLDADQNGEGRRFIPVNRNAEAGIPSGRVRTETTTTYRAKCDCGKWWLQRPLC